MPRVLEDIMKPVAQEHVFCSALYSVLWHNARSLEKKEERERHREDFGLGGSESKESVSVELQPAFEIRNYVLYYICTVENY